MTTKPQHQLTGFTHPYVSLNGTSKQTLIVQYEQALELLSAARAAVHDARPNSRDFPSEAFQKAEFEHLNDLDAIRAVEIHLREMLAAVLGDTL